MKVRVDVRLKSGVLDPQGRAVAHALNDLGFTEVNDVRIGKAIELEINETDAETAKARAAQMADKLLANLVIESYQIEVLS